MMPTPRKAGEPCRSCADFADHCHGTSIVHADGSVECTEFKCVDLSDARHAHVVSCTAVVRQCGCREEDALLH